MNMYLLQNIAATCTAKHLLMECLKPMKQQCNSMLKSKYISEISVISANAVNQIAEFNNTACEYDRSKTISDMFDEVVQAIPDHTAVVYKDKKYTYKATG